MWDDGLVVKAFKCGKKGCGSKHYLEHIIKNPKFRDSEVYDINWHDLPIMSTWKINKWINKKLALNWRSKVVAFWIHLEFKNIKVP